MPPISTMLSNVSFYSSLLPKYLVLQQPSIQILLYMTTIFSNVYTTSAFRLASMWLCVPDTAFCDKVCLVVFVVGVDCLTSFSNKTDCVFKNYGKQFLD